MTKLKKWSREKLTVELKRLFVRAGYGRAESGDMASTALAKLLDGKCGCRAPIDLSICD